MQILSTDATDAPRRYYLTDMLGSVVAITSDTGAVVATYGYDPYGNTRVATGPDAAANPIRYTGGHLDLATGLYKFGARFYDPTTGRFTQMDPSGQEANPYLYAGGNPCNYTDPSGLSFRCSLASGLAGGLGAVVGFGLGAIGGPVVVAGAVGGFVGGAAAGYVGSRCDDNGQGEAVVDAATQGVLGAIPGGILGKKVFQSAFG